MALPISNIPILTGAAASSFVKNAEDAERNRGSVDFSRQCAEWSGFDARNAARIAKLRAEGKWPFQNLPVFERYYLDPDNKTGCRYLVVDAYNQPVPLAFYEANGFKYMFSSELQECEYRKIESVAKLHTRMMYFDLMLLTNQWVVVDKESIDGIAEFMKWYKIDKNPLRQGCCRMRGTRCPRGR